MPRKKRYYDPTSAQKMMLKIYSKASARAGVYATESPILQMMFYEYAKNVAQKRNEIASWASWTYHQIISKYDLAPYQKTAVWALINKASKYVKSAKRGIKVDKAAIDAELRQTATALGVTIPGEIIDAISSAVTAEF